ncbi:MAG: 1-acyl-sn-glycerol-3-phosphate acyltransferase [Treponema sp.]|jgi:1-acyl-sn-glycerol-3-phosphate acyltransferase|nr:1-acyl-sn-glycerol-3-phosphate acyltransferase [Treponema sp.]
MNIRRAVVNAVIKRLLDILCEIDATEFVEALRTLLCGGGGFSPEQAGISRGPLHPAFRGPMIVAVNHINFLEVPILVTHSYPLLLTGLVKSETWKNPLMAFLFDTYKAIPIDRRGSYLKAFRQVGDALAKGFFVVIAPEGSRSKNGILRRGKAGVVQLALITGAPVLPVVHFGGEKIWDNLRHFKRTPFRFRVGRPFRFKYEGRPDRQVREAMLTELMGQMAALLPEEMRGVYAEQVQQECKYLEFLDSTPL